MRVATGPHRCRLRTRTKLRILFVCTSLRVTNTVLKGGHYDCVLFHRDWAVLHLFTVWSASAVGIEGHVECVQRTCVRGSWRLPVISDMMQHRERRHSTSLVATSVVFSAVISAVLQVWTACYLVPCLFFCSRVFLMVEHTCTEYSTFLTTGFVRPP